MRTGELIALEWEDIDCEHKDMRINKTHNRGKTSAPKTKNSNIVNDILPIVEKYLKEQRNLLG